MTSALDFHRIGFPGETDSIFAYLLDWLDDAEIDRVGCFSISGCRSRVDALGHPVH